MSHDERRSAFDKTRNRFLHVIFGNIIERGSRFVKDKYFRVTNQCSRYRNALFLSARKPAAMLTDVCVYPFGEGLYQFFEVGFFHDFCEFFVGIIIHSVSYVLFYRSGEKYAVLRNDGYRMAIYVEIYIPHRVAVD